MNLSIFGVDTLMTPLFYRCTYVDRQLACEHCIIPATQSDNLTLERLLRIWLPRSLVPSHKPMERKLLNSVVADDYCMREVLRPY